MMASPVCYEQLFSFAVLYSNPDETVRQASNFSWHYLVNIVKDTVQQNDRQWRRCVLEVNYSMASLFLLDKDCNVSTHLFTEYKKHIIQEEDSLIILRFSDENWQLIMQNVLERNTLVHLLKCCKKNMTAEAAANGGKGLVGLDRTVLRSGMIWRQGMLKYNSKKRYLVLVPGKLLVFKSMDIQGKHVRYVTTLIGARIHVKYGLQFRIHPPRMKEVTFLPTRPEDMTAWIASFKESIAIGDRIGEASPYTYRSQYEEASPSTNVPLQRYSDVEQPRYPSASAWTPYLEQPELRQQRGLSLVRMDPSVYGTLPWKREPAPAFASFQSMVPPAASQVPYNSMAGFSPSRTTPSRFQTDLSRDPSPMRDQSLPPRQDEVSWMHPGLQTEFSRQHSPSRLSQATRGQVPVLFLGGHSRESVLPAPSTSLLQGQYYGEDPRGSPPAASAGSHSIVVRRSLGGSRSSLPGLNMSRPSRGSSLPPLPAIFDTVQPTSPPRSWQNQQQFQQSGWSQAPNSFRGESQFGAAQHSGQFQVSRNNSPSLSFQGAGSPDQQWSDPESQSHQAFPHEGEFPNSYQKGYEGEVFQSSPRTFSSAGQVIRGYDNFTPLSYISYRRPHSTFEPEQRPGRPRQEL